MPYRSRAEAEKAGATVELDGAKLSLPQINAIAAVADRLKSEDKVDSPYAVAVSAFKKSHKIEGGKWVEKNPKKELSAAEEAIAAGIFKAVDRDAGTAEWYEFEAPAGTRTVKDVELLEEGVHIDRHNRVLMVDETKIKAIPGAYRELAAVGFRPSVRLTHDEDHPLASGFPSLGWPINPRAWYDENAVGGPKWKVSSDLAGVPNLFADIMEAGGYDRVSSGLYEDVKVGDFTAPLAIDHVAVLGVAHPAVMGLKGISGIHRLYENEMAAREGVTVSAAYLFEDAGLKPDGEKEGGATMPDQLTPEQLASLGVTSETELRAKIAKGGEAEKIESKAKIELEAARGQMRLAAANGMIAKAAEKIPPALHDDFRVVHMGLAERGAPVEFARPSADGISTETVKKDPLTALESIVGKLGKAIELQDEKAPEGGKDQEHMTDDEKAAAKLAEEKKAEEKKAEEGADDKPEEGKTDDVVELARGGIASRTAMAVEQKKLATFLMGKDESLDKGTAMSVAAVELGRARFGTDAYVPPEGLEKPKEEKGKTDEKK